LWLGSVCELASTTHRRVELTALTAAHRIPAIYQRFFPGRLDRFELPAQRSTRVPQRRRSSALNQCAARTWQVDPFVTGPLGLVVHDFGARSGNPVQIAVVKFEAA
jgi:hypothetical protein